MLGLLRSFLILCVLLTQQARAAMDGVAVTLRVRNGAPAQPAGDLIWHSIEKSKPQTPRTIYDGRDVVACVLSPDGTRVAFQRADRTVAITDGEGRLREVGQLPSTPALQWPSGEGGRWIYGVSRGSATEQPALQRINVESGAVERVVVLNMSPMRWGLSADATSSAGRLVACPQEWNGAAGYDLSDGDGDLYRRPLVDGASDVSLSHDGTLLLAHGPFGRSLFDWNGKQIAKIDGPGSGGAWAVNSAQWLILNRADGADGNRSSVVLRSRAGTDETLLPGRNEVAGSLWVRDAPPPSLGKYRGEAPFTIELRPLETGEWEWDFDGPTARGTVARHTFDEPGTYEVTARLGDLVVSGEVIVDEASPPRLLGVDVLTDRWLAARFNERVDRSKPTVSLRSGARVEEIFFSGNGNELLIRLAQDLGGKDELIVADITDTADRPNRLPRAAAPLEPPGWPREREELLLLWQGAKGRNTFFHEPSRTARRSNAIRGGRARLDRFGSMTVTGGGFILPVPRAPAVEGFTLELILRPHEQVDAERPLSVATVIGTGGEPVLRLIQRGEMLEARLSTKEAGNSVDLISLKPGRTYHLVLTRSGQHFTCYHSGERIAQVELDPSELVVPRVLRLGSPASEESPGWHGTIEAVALHRTAMTPEQIIANGAPEIRRPRPAPLEVTARLVRKTRTPAPANVAPYRDALVVCEYEVVEVLRGQYHGRRIRIAHFGMLDLQPMPINREQAGATHTFQLEPLTRRPDLETVLLADTLPENFDLDVFVPVDP